jgi:2-haloacid dehalogenase
MTRPIQAVVYDFGGVLFDWNPRHLYRKLFGTDEAGMERFLAEVATPEWNLAQDAGRPWREAVDLLVAAHPAQAELIRAFHLRWGETLAGLIDGSLAVLTELKDAGTTLYGLTNWSQETFPVARARYPWLGWFDGIVVSGEEKLVKPDPRLFQVLIDRYHLDPARLVYIDDSPANVEAAAKLGMDAIHFTDAAKLRAELVRRELLPAEATR